MGTHVEGTFTLTGFDEDEIAELPGGGKVTRASIGQDHAGGLEGHSDSDVVMVYRPDGTASIVGFIRMSGTLDGREGSFVVESHGGFDGEFARDEWTVVDGSGTGGLSGLRGTGGSAAPHGPNGTWTLDYELD